MIFKVNIFRYVYLKFYYIYLYIFPSALKLFLKSIKNSWNKYICRIVPLLTGDLLQRVQLKHSAMEKCENISIPSVNSVCTEQTYSMDDCNVSKTLFT